MKLTALKKLHIKIPPFLIKHQEIILTSVLIFIICITAIFSFIKILSLNSAVNNLSSNNVKINKSMETLNKEYSSLKSQDQIKINQELMKNDSNIESTYKTIVSDYEKLLDLKIMEKDTGKFDIAFAEALSLVSQRNYASASSALNSLGSNIQAEEDKIQASLVPTVPPAPQSNNAPGSGRSRQNVSTDVGTFLIDIIASDLNSTRVIADTASDSDCGNNCPVLPLADYVSRSGAFAGINGTFFCPAEYPSCAGKTGSFDTLLMNKNKHYFNSDNNVYSTVPVVVFKDNWARFISQSLQWGRDTSVDSVIAMQPSLILNSSIVYGGSDNPKFNAKGARTFIANKDNMVYIGVIYNATMSDGAHVLKTLGMQNALNLDEGGSTALWYGGYIAGPGRNIPNAVLFVHK